MATLAHGGRTLATYDIIVTDAAGHRVCTARLTCLIRDQVPGRDGAGPASSGPTVSYQQVITGPRAGRLLLRRLLRRARAGR